MLGGSAFEPEAAIPLLAAEVKVDELVEADMAAREAGKGERALELTISYTGAACRYETRTAATGANDDRREPTLGDSSFFFARLDAERRNPRPNS